MPTYIYGILLYDKQNEVNKVFPNLINYSRGGLIPGLRAQSNLVLRQCPHKTHPYVFGRELNHIDMANPLSISTLSSWESSEKGIDAQAEISKVVEKSGLQRKLDIYIL